MASRFTYAAVAGFASGSALLVYWQFFVTDFQICRFYDRFLVTSSNCSWFDDEDGVDLPPVFLRHPQRTLPLPDANLDVEDAPVPHIMHHLDRVPPKPQAVEWMMGWVRRLPDWTHCFWSDEDIDELLSSWNRTSRCKRHIERLDYARYVMLWLYGGVYKDTDMLARDPMIEDISGMWVWLGPESNAMLASSPLHPFWPHVFREAALPPEGMGILDTCGPGLVNVIIKRGNKDMPNGHRSFEFGIETATHVSSDRWSAQVRRVNIRQVLLVLTASFVGLMMSCNMWCSGKVAALCAHKALGVQRVCVLAALATVSLFVSGWIWFRQTSPEAEVSY